MSCKKIILLLIVLLSVFTCTSCGKSSITKEKFTISYHPEGGDMRKTEQVFKDYTKVEMYSVKRPGYTFLGWYNSRGVKINRIYANKDYELFARWEKIPASKKPHEVIMSDVNLIDSVEITEDGLIAHLKDSINSTYNYEVLFAYGDQTELLRESLEAFVVSSDTAFSEDLRANFRNSISVRVYYEEELPEQVNCYYSNIQTFTIFDLITRSYNSLELEIFEEFKLVPEIKFTLNTLKYTVSTDSSLYTAKLKQDSQLSYITVTITLVEGYTMYEFVDVYRNDKLITQNFEINENSTVLTYTISDPNWTQGW